MSELEDQLRQQVRKLEINVEELASRFNVAKEQNVWMTDRVQTLERICRIYQFELAMKNPRWDPRLPIQP